MIQEETKQSNPSGPKVAVTRMSAVSRLVLLVILAAGAVALYSTIHAGIQSRVKASGELEKDALEAAVSTVQIVHPVPSSLKEELTLPGNAQAYQATPIFARIGGYLKKWHCDIGTRVKAGQLLAEIETPELDRQLDQVRADLATAQANLTLAQTTADRYANLLKTESVSRQDFDNRSGDLLAKKSTVDSAAASLRRLEETQRFQKVYAPFDGVITARNVDVGALIDTSNTTGKQMFDLAEIDRLRVFVNVPQMYTRAITVGAAAELTLAEMAGRRFTGKVVRRSESIDPGSRTLLTEVDFDNKKGEVLPGSFVQLSFKLGGLRSSSVVVPVSALIFRSEGLQVAVVRENKTALVPVTMGRDFGNTVELSSGVTTNDLVIDNPADSLASGATVQVQEARQPAKAAETKEPAKAAEKKQRVKGAKK